MEEEDERTSGGEMTIARGFASTKEQATHLQEYGLPDKDIWLAGRGAETLDRCLATFRGRPGTLIVAHDLRVLGASKRAVAEVMGQLEAKNIRVVDISHPEHTTVAALMQTASIAISGARFRDRRVARRQGRAGGLAKGAKQDAARSEIATPWLVRNIVAERSIPWEVKLRLLGGKFSEATLRRHYMNA